MGILFLPCFLFLVSCFFLFLLGLHITVLTGERKRLIYRFAYSYQKDLAASLEKKKEHFEMSSRPIFCRTLAMKTQTHTHTHIHNKYLWNSHQPDSIVQRWQKIRFCC